MSPAGPHPLRDKLSRGDSLIGIWSIIPSSPLTDIIGAAGFDFQILDLEHGFYSIPQLEIGIRSCQAAGCAALVRPPTMNHESIQSALDLGAHGLVVPQVKGVADTLKVVQATRFAPHGQRGFNPFTRVGKYGTTGMSDNRMADGWPFVSVIIENEYAFAEIADIVAIPHLDMIYLGVYDMSVALGCPGETLNPRVLDFIERATAAARQAGKAVGVLAKNGDEMKRFLDVGANVIVYVVDSFIISQAMISGVAQFRDALTR